MKTKRIQCNLFYLLHHYSHRTDAEKKWRVILNVMKALSNMRNFNTNDVKSISDLDQRFNLWLKEQPKALKLSSDNPKDTMDLVLRQFKLFDYVASGLDSNIEKIKKILKSDPKLNIFDDKEAYFVNQKNYEGHTSLYVACLHGHLKIVQVLLENKADHLILCGGEDDKESVLDTSIRWGHLKLVEYLLDNLKWPQDYLKSALKKAIDGKNEKMIQMVKKSIAQTRKTNLGQCRCVLF